MPELTSPQRSELLEREAERVQLEDALVAARSGPGRLIVIEGEPGIGKSRLLDYARGRAHAHELRVVAAAGLELESDFPFGLALRLLEPALAAVDETYRATLLADTPAAARLFAGQLALDSATGADHGYALVHGLHRLTIGLIRAGGVPKTGAGLLICVDDLQWSDGPSLRWLARLAADIPALPVTIVVALRPPESGVPAELGHLLIAGRTLRPAALTERAIEHLTRAAYPHASPEFPRACARATAGNPFYLHALLDTARAEGMRGTSQDAAGLATLVPKSVARSVLLRVAALSAPAAAIASAAAVLGDGVSLHQVARLADVDPRCAEQAADALASAHILRPGEPIAFTHALIAAAVRADIPALARSRAHRQAADLLSADGASAEAIAAHLLACRGEGDPAAVHTLRTAAARAAGQGAHRSAQRLLTRALAEPPPRALRVELEIERALAEAAVGTPDAVARVRAALSAVDDPERRIMILRALARLLFAGSQFDAAVDAIEQAQAEQADEAEAEDELLVDALATASLASAPSALTQARARQLVDRACRGSVPRSAGLRAQLASMLLSAGRPAAEVVALARAAAVDLPADDGFYGVITGFAVITLVALDALDDAQLAIDRALAYAGDSGSLIAIGTANHWLAELRYHQGRPAEAITAAEQTLQVCRAGWDMCSACVAPILAHAHMDRGELAAASDAVSIARERAGKRFERGLALVAEGRLALLTDDVPGALQSFLAAGEHAERHHAPPTMLAWRGWAALAAARAGDGARAEELAQAELAQVRLIGAPRSWGVALRVAGSIRGGAEGLGLLAEAAAVLERSPAALERARALVALGVALRRDGQASAAREPLRRGLELGERLGATPLALQARDELHAAGGRRRRVLSDDRGAGLTPSERRIAQLAAGGLSTPEIAQQLYLAPKTVDWHLGHAYRKLNIRSRRQLARVLDAVAGGSAPLGQTE